MGLKANNILISKFSLVELNHSFLELLKMLLLVFTLFRQGGVWGGTVLGDPNTFVKSV